MTSEADLDALREHLVEVHPIFDQFCRNHHFTYVRSGLGRSPRIRVERVGAITIWLELWIELVNGDYPKYFHPDLTYELSAGGTVDLRDAPSSRRVERYSHSFQCFSNIPFVQVPMILGAELEKGFSIIEKWDTASLQKDGLRQELMLPLGHDED